MKSGIHPKYYSQATVTCACGNTFTTGSTHETIITEICSNCHPFYTGKQKLVDTLGTVDKFKKRMTASSKLQSEVKEKKPRKLREKK